MTSFMPREKMLAGLKDLELHSIPCFVMIVSIVATLKVSAIFRPVSVQWDYLGWKNTVAEISSAQEAKRVGTITKIVSTARR